jgi:hypothetical protein
MAFKPALIRQIHQYFGLFIAPCVMFFSLTGAYQLFGWHESHEGYHPPAIVEKLGMLHKDQLFITRPERKPPAAAPKPKADVASAAKPKAEEAEKPQPFSQIALKWLFLVVALGLFTSTATGLWMTFTHPRQKRSYWVVLALGAALPVLLLLV